MNQHCYCPRLASSRISARGHCGKKGNQWDFQGVPDYQGFYPYSKLVPIQRQRPLRDEQERKVKSRTMNGLQLRLQAGPPHPSCPPGLSLHRPILLQVRERCHQEGQSPSSKSCKIYGQSLGAQGHQRCPIVPCQVTIGSQLLRRKR